MLLCLYCRGEKLLSMHLLGVFFSAWPLELVSNKLPTSRRVLCYMLSSPASCEIWEWKEKIASLLCLFKDL